MAGIVGGVLDHIAQALTGRRRLQLRVHEAHFVGDSTRFYFLNLTNVSRDRELEVTHVYLDLDPQVHAIVPDRPLPKRLKPDEAWETWIAVAQVPVEHRPDVGRLGRARLSNGRTVKSRPNANVPTAGTVPGGPIEHPPRGA